MSTTARSKRNSPTSTDGTEMAAETRSTARARASASRKAAPAQQSVEATSPFTPIADYAFLSNCHTGALVAPDGTVDWLCVPRFDSPSVFGSLLDRGAGMFRLGPFGVNVSNGHTYEPGTNSLLTSWKSPTGWATVREALTMGPREGEDTMTPHTRPFTVMGAATVETKSIRRRLSATGPATSRWPMWSLRAGRPVR